MKRVLILLMALGVVVAFASAAMAQKSVVAIVKATAQDNELLDGHFAVRELVDLSLKDIEAYAASEGDHTRCTWDEASEEVWYKYVKQACDLAGGIPLKKGEAILIKPNHVLSYYPMQYLGYGDANSIQGAFADPRATLAVARIAKEMGASRIIIAECPAFGDAWATYMNYGLVYAQKRYADMGIKYELIDLCESWEMIAGPGLASKQYPMPKLLKQVQCLVPISAFKTHSMAGVTLALKNMGIGLPSARVIGANKFGLPHDRLAEVNADVSWIAKKLCPKQMHIIDAVYAGTWVPVAPYFRTGLIIASKDPVAADAIGTAIMNLNPRNIGTTRLSAQVGVGKMEYDEIEVVGVPLEEAIIQDFPRHPYTGRWLPWAPDRYGKITNWDQYYRHPSYGVPNYPRW